MPRSKSLLFIVALTILCWFAKPLQAEKLNFIFLLVDDWGWTDGGCFGSDVYETPNMDQLAATGMRFTNGYAACTVCSPTRASVMSGKYPPRTGVTNWISDASMKLRHEEVTIAEVLKTAGYKTAHVGKWHLAPRGAPDVADYYPEDQGFDINVAGNHWGAPGSYFHPYTRGTRTLGTMPKGGKEGDFLTDRLTDEAIEIIDDWKDDPFFLYFPYYAVHTPIEGRPDLVEHYKAKIKPGSRHKNAKYAAMVHAVDLSVGRITKRLEELGIADRTAIFLTGDNGGLDRKGNPTENTPLRAGKGSAYEGGVRVPTVVKWPGVTPEGSVNNTPVISVDYYPTMLAMAGLKGDAKHNKMVDGVDLSTILKDPKSNLGRDELYWHYPHSHGGGAKPHGAIRDRDWRLVRFYGSGNVELYNLAEDISEKNDLAAQMPDIANRLNDKLSVWLKDTGAKFPRAKGDRKK
ncbi:MAG: arylsulfatase A [Pirellulaceae bacterium]|jgi:arylsulfatase A